MLVEDVKLVMVKSSSWQFDYFYMQQIKAICSYNFEK